MKRKRGRSELDIRDLGKCNIHRAGKQIVIMINVAMDEELPMIDEVVRANGALWKITGIQFHVGTKEGDIGLTVEG